MSDDFDDEMCCCGHVWDEHDVRSSACEVLGCDCFYFEADKEGL